MTRLRQGFAGHAGNVVRFPPKLSCVRSEDHFEQYCREADAKQEARRAAPARTRPLLVITNASNDRKAFLAYDVMLTCAIDAMNDGPEAS